MPTFALFLKHAHGLRGRCNRVAKVIFRGSSFTTDVYEFCTDAEWEEEFDWEVNGSLKPTDYVEIQILNYKKLIPSKVIATFQMFLKKLIDEPWISITDNLVDLNSTVLSATISLEVMFIDENPRETTFESFHPEEEVMTIVEDWELQSRRSSRKNSRFSLTSHLKRKFGSLTSSKREALIEMGELELDEVDEAVKGIGTGRGDKEPRKKKSKEVEKPKEKENFNLHPKVRCEMKQQREEMDVNVQIRIIEGKQLAGTQLDPVCDIHCFGQKKSTQTKEQTNTPYWDEFFVFDTINQVELAFDEIIEFFVYSGRNLISKGFILGYFKIDLGTVYAQPDHRFIRKFACLVHPDEILGASGAGIKGYLKMDITVLVKGDPVKEPPSSKDGDDDVDENALLPEGVKSERMRQRYCVKILKAEGLPKMNSGILANIRKQFTGETRIRDLADPFVKVSFAGQEAQTSVKKNSYDPEWVEEIVFADLFPSLCRRMKIQLKDQDVTKQETVGTMWIDLSEISNDGCNVNKFNMNAGFMPTLGPTWVNFYGSSRDYWFRDQNEFLNEGLQEGIGYRGRLLISVQMEDGESAQDDEISNIHVKKAKPLSDVVGGKEENFQLFCCIHEASMIDRKTANKPIQFEMNIGNYGNTFDGKMLSSKDDDDEEEEDDKYTKPLTQPMTAESLDREYYNMPYYENKPCMHIRFPWEDHRRRLFLQNILHKFIMKLEDSLEDTDDRISIDAEDTWEYLTDALNELTKSCESLIMTLGAKITGAKVGKTKLDKERLNLCISVTKEVIEEVKQILENLKDNRRINSTYHYVRSFIERYNKLMKEPQAAFPDIFIWLLSGGKRTSYIRIPANKVMYSPIKDERGVDSGQIQTYLLTLPGKSGLGEKGWAIKCKLTCLVWLGILKTKKDMLLNAPEGYEILNVSMKVTAPPPLEIHYTTLNKFTLRAHIYQARGLIGSDDSGLSDAFCRVTLNNQSADTSVVWETRSPTWNQTLMFYDLVIYGNMDFVVANPPTIMAEMFDYDDGGDIEFIGRAMCRPLVKRIEDPYDKPLFPPKLEWFQIYRGASPAGELLAAYEFFQMSDDPEEMNLPPDPVEMEDEVNGGTFFMVPETIRPVMAQHRIECLFWGVREMKNINFQAVDRPQVEFECVSESVKSPSIASAKVNPNFTEPWAYFDLDLPEEAVYCPPLTISVRDTRMFGKTILVGTSIVNSLLNYVQDSSAYEEAEEGGTIAEKEEEAAEENKEEEGTDNNAFEEDAVGSTAPSKAKSLVSSLKGSRVASIAGSKAVSFASGSKKGSFSGSKLGSTTSNIKPYSPLAQTEISINQRRKSTNPNAMARPATPRSYSYNRGRAVSRQSSQIHFHIVSNPGLADDIPLKKVFTPRHKKETKNEETAEETDSRSKVTPFKKLMSRSATPSKDAVEQTPLLAEAEEQEVPLPKQSPGQKLIQQITTPIKSIGSKLTTPLKKSKQNTPTHETIPEETLVEEVNAPAEEPILEPNVAPDDLQVIDEEEIEMAVGAEAADYAPPEEEKVDEEEEAGDLEEKVDNLMAEEEKGNKDEPVGLDEDGSGEEQEPEETAAPTDIIAIGEEELKAEEEAAAAEATEEEGEDENEDDNEGEEQVDWWSRFYETVKDEERIQEAREELKKKKKKAEAKKGKKAVIIEAEDGEEEEEDLDELNAGKKKKIINPKIIRLKIFKTELEEVPRFDGLCDVLESWLLLRGKSNGNDEDDESRIYGKFKGAIKVWKYPLPSLFYDESNTLGSFKRLPSMDPVNVLCRVYVVKAIDLKPTDLDGKADPYIKVQVGKQINKDRDNYIPKQLNPSFGRVFDFEVTLPHDNMLTIGVYDYDLVGSDDLIGETKIDIENRFFSKHRATCGMSVQYAINGFNKWRDPIKPTAILQRLCKDLKLDGPHFTPGKCRVNKWVFHASETITDDNGNPKQSDEPSALKALHNFGLIEGKGYPLVPEHVETRSLLTPEIPGIEQGRIQLWVDLFNMEGPSPGASIDITPRKPTSYEMRCIIWNTEDVILGDLNILTGQPCADIYVKGWIEGLKNNSQSTDVHTSSLTGEGNFNWRFIFPFKFHKAEERVVIVKKTSMFSWGVTEEKVPARLVLQCWDSDALSSDDFIGDVTLNLTSIPRPAKTSIQCNIETMNNENRDSIFKKKNIKGWWPFILDTADAEPELVGKAQVEIQLLTEQEVEEDPAGLGRKEPNPLPFPDRPDLMMNWMMMPIKALRYALWEQHKYNCMKGAALLIIFAIMGLFFYTMPGAIVKQLVG